MGLVARIRDRRRRGVGLIAWLVDHGGWRVIAEETLATVSPVRRARRGQDDPLARGADAVGDAIGQVGDGTE